MKTVLISIKRNWWEKILSGEKEIEIRKSAPKDIEFPFKVVCYQSGKGIVGQFICECVTKSNLYKYFESRSCLTVEELMKYANLNTTRKDQNLYGWIIKKGSAMAYDEVYKIEAVGMARPPQSWCYIADFTDNKVAYSFDNESYSTLYDNEAEALEDALKEIKYYEENEYSSVPEKVYIGQCELFKPSLSSSGYDVIEAAISQADDEGFGEWDEDYLSDVTKEQREELEEELDAVFQKWITKHGLEANFFKVNSFDTYNYINGILM
ncbi:hypothetical protein [Lacrimispora indolis]|uniref:hypothetical protein n=1 Tax=Lacrimispora indolis TaxID=69825 RepID=UPI0012EBC005|nr:hypothetical protein [[Clostridium] methoxybenzovorans]